MLFKKKKQIPPEEIKLDEIDRESKYKIFSPRGDKILTVVLIRTGVRGICKGRYGGDLKHQNQCKDHRKKFYVLSHDCISFLKMNE